MGLSGESGCGKSTLLKSINRMNDLIEGCRIDGQILLDGQDIFHDIDVNLQPIVRNENYYNAELGKGYDLPASYEVDVPLSFEQGLNIVYNDSVQDLNKDLNDLDKVSLKMPRLCCR